MSWSNFEINLILTWSSTWLITNCKRAGRFAITDAKRYVSIVTLSTCDIAKLLQQLKSNWINTKQKKSTEAKFLDILINPNLQGVNRIFLLSFESDSGRTSHSQYYLPKVEIKC